MGALINLLVNHLRLETTDVMADTQATSAQVPPMFLLSKAHIAGIATFTYCLFATGYQHFIMSRVFLPPLLWEIAEMVSLKTHKTPPAGTFIGIVLLHSVNKMLRNTQQNFKRRR